MLPRLIMRTVEISRKELELVWRECTVPVEILGKGRLTIPAIASVLLAVFSEVIWIHYVVLSKPYQELWAGLFLGVPTYARFLLIALYLSLAVPFVPLFYYMIRSDSVIARYGAGLVIFAALRTVVLYLFRTGIFA
jgi:hypothetical protein